MAKMLEDSFRTLGILEDDSPKFVNKSILEVIEVPRPKKGARANFQSQGTNEEDYVEVDIISN